MKYITPFVILLLAHPIASNADYSVQGVRTSCSSTGFEIAAYNLANETPSASVILQGRGQAAYFGAEKHVVTCEVGKHKIKTEFQTGEPRARGECGGAPGSRLSMWLNGNLLMQNQLFNNHCFESLNKILFTQNKEGELTFSVCGRRSLDGAMFNDCFEFKPEAFVSLKKPFGPFPLSDMATYTSEEIKRLCENFLGNLNKVSGLSSYRLAEKEVENEDWNFVIQNVDIDQDRIEDQLLLFRHGSASIIPADNSTFTLIPSTTGERFSLESQRLSVIVYKSNYYVATSEWQSEKGPIHTDIYSIAHDGFDLLCSYKCGLTTGSCGHR